jgi:hypothetical protein
VWTKDPLTEYLSESEQVLAHTIRIVFACYSDTIVRRKSHDINPRIKRQAIGQVEGSGARNMNARLFPIELKALSDLPGRERSAMEQYAWVASGRVTRISFATPPTHESFWSGNGNIQGLPGSAVQAPRMTQSS